MIFLPGQARLVTLTEDNHLHLWEINGTTLQACLKFHIHIPDPKPEMPEIQVQVGSGLAHIGIGFIRPETRNSQIFELGSGFGDFRGFARSS